MSRTRALLAAALVLAAVGLTDHYRQIFELTRLDEAIALHADAASALASA